MTLEEVLSHLDRIAPFSLALPWDNSGIQVGDPLQEVTGALLALEPTSTVVKEALSQRVQLIVTHHPLIFSPLKGLLLHQYPGSLISSLVKEGLALVAMHTNWDVAPGGLSDALAQKLDLEVDAVLEPFPQGEGGIGRVGSLPQPVRLVVLAQKLMEELPAPWARVVGDPERTVERVAVCPGSGGDLWPRARDLGAQALITGDIKHHQAREASEEGFALLDLGHFATEAWGMGVLAERIRREIPSLRVLVESSLRDPFTIYIRGGSRCEKR